MTGLCLVRIFMKQTLLRNKKQLRNLIMNSFFPVFGPIFTTVVLVGSLGGMAFYQVKKSTKHGICAVSNFLTWLNSPF